MFTGVHAAQYLCISVFDAEGDEAVAIPETDPYMVTTKYSCTNNGVSPMGRFRPSGGEHALGKHHP